MNRSCSACGAEISATARFCRVCGRAQPPAPFQPSGSPRIADGIPNHEDSPTIFSCEPADESQHAHDALPVTDSSDVTDSSGEREVELPDVQLSCEICGAAVVGGEALCLPCARLIGSEERLG